MNCELCGNKLKGSQVKRMYKRLLELERSRLEKSKQNLITVNHLIKSTKR